MIEAQIDRLSAEEQRVLEVASLGSIGRSRFAVAPTSRGRGTRNRKSLKRCVKRFRGGIAFCARPALRSSRTGRSPHVTSLCTRSTARCATGELPRRRRAKLHRRLGEWAEAHWERVNEDAAWLAGHFEQGGDWPRAIKYLQLAADTAGRLFGPRQAAEILEHALDLVDRLPEAERPQHEITILEKLGSICNASLDSRAIDRARLLLWDQTECHKSGGRDFLKSWHFYRPDCLVLDLQIPDLSGTEVQNAYAKSRIPIF